jgi:hypothetical protein
MRTQTPTASTSITVPATLRVFVPLVFATVWSSTM